MKKQIIAAAIAAAVAAPAAMAGAPTVYGQINMSVDNVNIDLPSGYGSFDGDGVEVSSNASRIGVKGSSDLGNGLKAVYKLEWGVSVDGAGTLSGRNQYVGLAGSFGTVLLGRHDTPTKMSQPTDFFNDGPGDLKYASVTGAMGSDLKGGEIRAGNVLAYVSPSFSGVKFVGALVPSEGAKRGNDGSSVKDSGLADTYSIALMYGSKKKGLYLAAAHDEYATQQYDVIDLSAVFPAYTGNLTAVVKNANMTRLSAQYAMGALVVNGVYQTTDLGKVYDTTSSTWQNAKDVTTWVVSGAYTMGALTPKLKYAESDWSAKGAKVQSLIGVGVDYTLAKKTSAYVEYVAISNLAAEKGLDKNTISVGLLHKF